MWGLRAVRVGVLVGGLLALIAGSGCCTCCQNLWGTKSAPPAEVSDEDKERDEALKNWRRPWFTDQPGHLTPERIHGGIY